MKFPFFNSAACEGDCGSSVNAISMLPAARVFTASRPFSAVLKGTAGSDPVHSELDTLGKSRSMPNSLSVEMIAPLGQPVFEGAKEIGIRTALVGDGVKV